MIKEFCPYCEAIRDVELISKTETLPVLGEPVEYEAFLYKCNSCSNEFATSGQEKENFRTAYDIYRKRHNLLSPERIKEIRQMYGLSQRGFSLFLGWGEVTIHRYEAGAIQDKVHNETLALLEDPRNALKILEMNKNDLEHEFYQEIEHRIKELIKRTPIDACVQDFMNIVLGWNQSDKSLDLERCGNRPFDFKKFENLVLYFLETCKSVGKTKLNKLLWYCDFKNFKEHGTSITGAKYLHLQYGPVPHNYDCLLQILSFQDKITSNEIFYDHYSGEEYYTNHSADVSVFCEAELMVIKYIAETLGNMTAKQLTEKSHEEEAYKATRHLEFISYKYASKLSI